MCMTVRNKKVKIKRTIARTTTEDSIEKNDGKIIDKNNMLIDEMLKFHKLYIDESRLMKKGYWAVSLCLLFVFGFLINNTFEWMHWDNSWAMLILFTIVTLMITLIVDRIIQKKIFKKYGVSIGSYLFPNNALNVIKVNELKKYLKANNLYKQQRIKFLINYLDIGVKTRTKFIFPFKGGISTFIISIFVMILTLTFTYSFTNDITYANQQLSEFFAYFVIVSSFGVFFLLLIANMMYQIITPTYIRIKELKRLLVQIYLEF